MSRICLAIDYLDSQFGSMGALSSYLVSHTTILSARKKVAGKLLFRPHQINHATISTHLHALGVIAKSTVLPEFGKHGLHHF